MASACCHACRLPCRHLAVQGSAHSDSQQRMLNQWQKPQVFRSSANSMLTTLSTPSTKYGRSHSRHAPLLCSAQAFVAQWIEHLTSDQRVGGSSPSERTNVYKGYTESGEPLQCWGHNKRSQHESSGLKTWNRGSAEPPHPSINVLVVFSKGGFIFESTTMPSPAIRGRLWLWQKRQALLLPTRLQHYPI